MKVYAAVCSACEFCQGKDYLDIAMETARIHQKGTAHRVHVYDALTDGRTRTHVHLIPGTAREVRP